MSCSGPKIPTEELLFQKYPYKVNPALEPFDYKVENWHVNRCIPYSIFVLFIVVLTVIVYV